MNVETVGDEVRISESSASASQPRGQGVTIEGLEKVFGRKGVVRAVDKVDLHIDEGELVVLLGPSGCGKSTILRCVAGLERPTRGRIVLSGDVVFDAATGADMRPNHRDVGMVFQNYALWPHMTARNNVAYPLKARHRRDLLRGGRVEQVLEAVHCLELADRLPAQLSGGQQQRIALARALVSQPAVMLLDEPLSNLDALLKVELRNEIRRVHREIRFTGIYVTHDQQEALNLGDRIVVMSGGTIAQVATPQRLIEAPTAPFVADFLGIRNKVPVPGQLPQTRTSPQLYSTSTRFDQRIRDGGLVYFRAEDAKVQPTDRKVVDPIPAGSVAVEDCVVADVAFGGAGRTDYVARCGDLELFITGQASSQDHPVGTNVRVVFPGDSALVYRDHVLIQ